MRLIALVAGLWLLAFSARCQRFPIKFHGLSFNPKAIQTTVDSSDLDLVTQNLIKQANKKGYAAFAVDSVLFQDNACHVYVYQGAVFRWDSLNADMAQLSPTMLKLRDKAHQNHFFNAQELYQTIQKQELYCQSLGYFNAQVFVKSLRYRSFEEVQRVSADLSADLGEKVAIDSIIFPPNLRERSQFVYSLIRMQPGQDFNPHQLPGISTILNNSLYYQNADTPSYRVSNRGAIISLKMQPRKNSRFDFLAGLLPPANNTAKFQFTVTADLMLISAFRTGELVSLQYNKLPDASQKLYVIYKQPLIFKTPFSPAVLFELQKQDTTFLRRKFEPSIGYDLSPNTHLQVFYRNITANLLQVGQFRAVKWPPPPYLDTRTNGFGVGLSYEKVNYRLNPASGKLISGELYYGQKRVFKNSGLDSLDFSRIPLSQPRFDLSANAQLYFNPAKKHHVIKLQLRGSWISMKNYFLNELPQYGGAKSLRGFNENIFTASAAAIGTLEYRYLLEKMSFFSAFIDYGWLKQSTYEEAHWVKPLGVGVGLQLETGAGILNVSYASGTWGDVPINPLRGKIHLGFVSLF